jgi:hypothetical protein
VTLKEAVLLPFVLAALAFAFASTLREQGQAFGAAFLILVGAAATGPFTFAAAPGAPRHHPLRQGAIAALAFAVAGALLLALAHGNAAAGALAGPFALALGALAYALGGGLARAAAAVLGLALLTTLFFWDAHFLFHAADRKASAALAFALNPAAAASVTLGFDWIHADVLYRGNQTVESLVGVPLGGAGAMAWKLLLIGGGAGGLGLLRKP